MNTCYFRIERKKKIFWLKWGKQYKKRFRIKEYLQDVKLLICSHNETPSSSQNLCFLLFSFLLMFLALLLPKRHRCVLIRLRWNSSADHSKALVRLPSKFKHTAILLSTPGVCDEDRCCVKKGYKLVFPIILMRHSKVKHRTETGKHLGAWIQPL